MAADPGDVAAGLLAAAGFLLAGVVRAGCDAWGARLSFQVARRRLSALRAAAVDALAGGSPLDKRRPAAGHAASVLAEQADAALPYLARYPAIQLKILVVPLAILAAVAPLSWVAALVLLASAPLIPVFMALVGWRAQRASQAHLAEMGTLNAFLLDRLRGLATLRALDAVDATTGRLAYVAQTLRTRTMAVLRIAFLSSAVLELFSAIGVAMVAVYVGFHLLGTLPFGTWGSPRASSSCCWPPVSSNRCATSPRPGTTGPRAGRRWKRCARFPRRRRSWWAAPRPSRRPATPPRIVRRLPSNSSSCASPTPMRRRRSSAACTCAWRPANGWPSRGRAARANRRCWR